MGSLGRLDTESTPHTGLPNLCLRTSAFDTFALGPKVARCPSKDDKKGIPADPFPTPSHTSPCVSPLVALCFFSRVSGWAVAGELQKSLPHPEAGLAGFSGLPF